MNCDAVMCRERAMLGWMLDLAMASRGVFNRLDPYAYISNALHFHNGYDWDVVMLHFDTLPFLLLLLIAASVAAICIRLCITTKSQRSIVCREVRRD